MLGGTTVVVVGTGDVGTHVGRLFRSMGCDVHGVSRSGSGNESVFSTCSTVSSLASLAATADWLIVTLPLTSETRALIKREVLEACRGAVLMNAGRGAVVDEALLPEALDKGWLRGVALDVFEIEPLPAESPLWTDSRVMISPHISGITTTEGAVAGFLDCLTAFERGETPKWIVDRERQY
jgi:phosphoglycerate dehydrogenase-like enzyme